MSTYGRDPVLVAYLNNFTDLWCSLFENTSTQGQDLPLKHTLTSFIDFCCSVVENISTYAQEYFCRMP